MVFWQYLGQEKHVPELCKKYVFSNGMGMQWVFIFSNLVTIYKLSSCPPFFTHKLYLTWLFPCIDQKDILVVVDVRNVLETKATNGSLIPHHLFHKNHFLPHIHNQSWQGTLWILTVIHILFSLISLEHVCFYWQHWCLGILLKPYNDKCLLQKTPILTNTRAAYVLFLF